MKHKIRLGDCYALTKHKLKQFKLQYISLLAVGMIMCLYAAKQVSAQGVEPAAAAVADIQPLKIGDVVPEETWSTPLTLWTAADNSTKTVKLNDYRGKVIILDFWATWCGNCLYRMPHQFALQERFADTIQTLPVTYEEVDYVMNFMLNSSSERLKSIKPMFRTIAENRTLLEHFPLNKTLPLVVVISPDGKIDAITTSEMLTEDYVGALIKGESRYAPLKRNGIEQVPQLLSFTINDVKQYKPIYYTSLSGEIDGTDAVKDTQVDTLKRTVRTLLANHTIVELYAVGEYGEGNRGFSFSGPNTENRVILEVAEPHRYLHHFDNSTKQRTVFNTAWLRKNRFTYESVMPLHSYPNYRRQLVDNLNRFFDVVGTIENRRVPVYILSLNKHYTGSPGRKGEQRMVVYEGWKRHRTLGDAFIGENAEGYISYVENMPMKSIPAMISREFTKIQNDPDFIMPLVIDETGISPELILNLGFAKPDQYRLDDLIGNLKRQGFELVLQEHNLPMFVVKQKGYEAAKGENLVLTKYGYVPESNMKYLPKR